MQDIEKDTDGRATIYTNEAINNVLAEFGDNREVAQDIKVDLKIFTDESGEAFPGYLVSAPFEASVRSLYYRVVIRAVLT